MADLHVLYEILYRLKMAESCLIEEILNYIYMNNYGMNAEYLISIITNPCEDYINTFADNKTNNKVINAL